MKFLFGDPLGSVTASGLNAINAVNRVETPLYFCLDFKPPLQKRRGIFFIKRS